MKKLKCYYAHAMITYNSAIEREDIALLIALGFEVINPNSEEIQNGCEMYKKVYGNALIMEYFNRTIDECDILAFRSLPSGEIPSGIAHEVKYAKSFNKPVIELPSNLTKRMLDYPTTKEILNQLGHYK